MALRGKRVDNFLELWCLVATGSLDIWVSSTSLNKNKIRWPQQPLTEKMLISVKNWIFDDIFYKKGLVLVILVPGMIQPSGSVILLMKWGYKCHWGHWGCWGCRGHFYLLFWKLVDETQMSKLPEATRLHKWRKLLILLPLRAI
jgi:hypothetical protein